MSRAGRRVGWLVMVVLVLVVAVVTGHRSSGPATGDEAAYLLAAESLARDGDFVLTGSDEDRARQRGWPETVRPQMLLVEDQHLRFAEPWIYPLVLAPFVVALGGVGVTVLNAVLLLALAAMGAVAIGRRSGEDGSWTVTALIFGSVLALYVAPSLPVMLVAALTAGAMTMFAAAAPAAAERQPDMYQPDDLHLEGVPRWRLLVRTLLGGLLLGLVAAHHVPALFLVGAAPALAPRRRGRTLVVASLGAAIGLLVTWPISGLWPESPILRPETPLVEVSIGSGVTEVDRARILETDRASIFPPSPQLLGWNVLYSLIGRHIGLLPYFLPLVVLALRWRRSERGSMLLLLAAAGVGASLLLAPFDFAGLPAALGNRHLVPFYVMLWWLPLQPLRVRGALVTAVAGVGVLGSLWWGAEGALERLQKSTPRGALLDYLPYETTQRDLPTANEVVTRNLLVRSIGGVGAGGRSGHFRLAKGRRARLLLASPGPLAGIDLEFDAAASTGIEVAGATVGNMMLTPSGGVTFEVVPAPSRIRHPTWWDAAPHVFYLLDVRMPNATGETTFSISSAR